VDDVGASNFGEVGSSQDNHLKQNEMRSPAIGQLRMSSLDKGVVTKQKAVLFSWGEKQHRLIAGMRIPVKGFRSL